MSFDVTKGKERKGDLLPWGGNLDSLIKRKGFYKYFELAILLYF